MPEEEQLLAKKNALEVYRQDYQEIKDFLKEFPDQKDLPSMVPFGNVAFLEGCFKNPNELYISLGLEYFAQYNCKEATNVIERRLRMIDDMIADVSDELDVFEIAKKLEIFTKIEEEEKFDEFLKEDQENGKEKVEESAIDILEEWSPEDEALFRQKSSRKSHTISKKQHHVSHNKHAEHQEGSREPTKPGNVAVKERIVERKGGKPLDPSITATTKQVKESLFKRSLRKDAATKGRKTKEKKVAKNKTRIAKPAGSIPIRNVQQKVEKSNSKKKQSKGNGPGEPKDVLGNTDYLRTPSRLQEAKIYMAEHEPVKFNGERKINDLVASPSEAAKAEPYDPEKFVKARHELLRHKNMKTTDTSQSEGGNGASSTKLNSFLLFALVFVIFI